jgi:hypothetical protein
MEADMPRFQRFSTLAICSLALSSLCFSQSVADAARQQKAKKGATDKPEPRHVITNDDVASGTTVASAEKPRPNVEDSKPSEKTSPGSEEEMQKRIRTERQRIAKIEAYMADIQHEMDKWKTSDCTHVLHANTSINACDEPQKLTRRYEEAQGRLKNEQSTLADLQEEARRLGYGNSFYDPK